MRRSPTCSASRDYYQALGYGEPYRWAHYAEVPFTPLQKPLADSRVGADHDGGALPARQGRPGAGAPYNAAAKFYTVYSGDSAVDHDLRISHVGYDRTHTTCRGQQHLVSAAGAAAVRGGRRIGEVAPRFHGAPTNRSHRATLEPDCPECCARCARTTSTRRSSSPV